MIFITIIIKYITYFHVFTLKKKRNQDTKCVMTIMIRDGLKMGAGGRRWTQMSAYGSIGVHILGGTRKCGGQNHRGHGLCENMTHDREIFRISCFEDGVTEESKRRHMIPQTHNI